jgi:hypothetical protein
MPALPDTTDPVKQTGGRVEGRGLRLIGFRLIRLRLIRLTVKG